MKIDQIEFSEFLKRRPDEIEIVEEEYDECEKRSVIYVKNLIGFFKKFDDIKFNPLLHSLESPIMDKNIYEIRFENMTLWERTMTYNILYGGSDFSKESFHLCQAVQGKYLSEVFESFDFELRWEDHSDHGNAFGMIEAMIDHDCRSPKMIMEASNFRKLRFEFICMNCGLIFSARLNSIAHILRMDLMDNHIFESPDSRHNLCKFLNMFPDLKAISKFNNGFISPLLEREKDDHQ